MVDIDFSNPMDPVVGGSPFGQKTSQTATGYSSGDNLSPDSILKYLREQSYTNTAMREKYIDFLLDSYRNKTANDWTAAREDSAWQRTVEDLRKAGISPYVLSGGTPAVSRATATSQNSSQLTSSENNMNNNWRSSFSSLLSMLGVVLAAGIYAL